MDWYLWNAGFDIRGVWEKSRQFVEAIRRKREPPLQVPETQSAFHPAHSETFSVAAMRIRNPDRSPLGINR
jgi:hypothetical protein